MRRTLELLPALAALTLAVGMLAPSEARAARLGLGADYLTGGGGNFSILLSVGTPLARNLSVGGRFGASFGSALEVGVPIDLYLRANFGRVYAEGLVGPWISFSGAFVRPHAAFGFGLHAGGGMSVGLEVGYLSPSPSVGLRLNWRI